MKRKEYILFISTLLLSGLVACGSKSEMQYLLEQGTEVELTIPTLKTDLASDSEEDAAELLWEQLASLTSSPEIRKAWDDTLSITLTDTGKNGMLYVNEAGDNENNNTLRVALHNREFQKAIAEDSLYYTELTDAVLNNYSDIAVEDDSKALYIGINDYFNLLPGTEGYSNADTYLSRAQFMAMVMRSETPVSDDLTLDEAFTAAVGHTDYNIYAQEVADHAYLTIEDKSLDVNTYTKEITRGEAVYLLMNKYFHDELQSIDTKNITLADTKDAGNILTEKQASEHDADAYIALKYAIDHADDGAPSAIYKSLCLAVEKGIISSETLWDDGLTLADAVDMLVQTLMQDPSMEEFNFKQGKVSGHEVDLTDKSTETPTGTDITGVDGGESLPGEYDAEVNDMPTEDLSAEKLDLPIGDDALRKIAEDIARDLNQGQTGGQVHQASQEALDALGATPAQTKNDGKHFGQGDYSGLEGDVTFE